jgi:ABC-type uncharacterized transport system ATPase subunit
VGVELELPELELKVFPEEITIENFKSIKRLTLRLKPGVNLLVGPNGAGKTNILESIYFFSKALSRSELLKIPYAPHLPRYWSPEDVFREKRVENPLGFEILFRIVRRRDEELTKHYVKFSTKFMISHERSSVEPAYASLDWGIVKFEIDKNEVRTYVNSSYVDKYLEIVEEVLRRKEEVLPMPPPPRLKRELESLAGKIAELKKFAIDLKHERYLLLNSSNLRETSLRRFLVDPFVYCIGYYRHTRRAMDLFMLSIRHLMEFPPGVLLPVPIEWRPASSGEFRGSRLSPLMRFTLNLDEIITWLEGCILLKHPDIGAISEPQPFVGGGRLDVRARNLPQTLYHLFAERRGMELVETIEDALKKVFGDIIGDVALEPRSSVGRVFFVIKERGIELPPTNIADGLIKVLAIAAAVNLNPSILLIDELENSLHAKALKYVYDLLNSLEVPVLVATHSPVIVDLASPERTIVVSRSPEAGTIVECFERPEALRERLNELGVAFSDYIFYEKTAT